MSRKDDVYLMRSCQQRHLTLHREGGSPNIGADAPARENVRACTCTSASPSWSARATSCSRCSAGYAVEARLIGVASLPPQHETTADLRAEQIWVAEARGEIAGVLGVEDEAEHVIARLVVAPAHMRRGIGRALARHALALAGDRVIRVGTAAANEPALELYRSLGFQRVGQRTVGDHLPYVDLLRPARGRV